jgi:hypothetical protein
MDHRSNLVNAAFSLASWWAMALLVIVSRSTVEATRNSKERKVYRYKLAFDLVRMEGSLVISGDIA